MSSTNTTAKLDPAVKVKPDRTIFVKKVDAKDTKPKPSPTMSTIKASVSKVKSNTTTRSDKIIMTVGQVLLKQGNRQPQMTKGKTTIKKVSLDKRPQTESIDRSTVKKYNLKDEPVYQKNNGTSKVLVNPVKDTKGSSNGTTSMKTVVDQEKVSMPNGTSTYKDKKPTHDNVTVFKVENKSEKHVNWTSIETKPRTKHFNRTSNRSSVFGFVKVHNITSTGFIVSWEAPLDTFKNFTVTRREIRLGIDVEENEGAEDMIDVQRPGSNRTSDKVHGSKLDGKTGKKSSQVLAGTARSYNFKGLQPQTHYSVSLFGSGPGVRSKIHRLTLYTGKVFYASCFLEPCKRGFLAACEHGAHFSNECMKYLIVHLKY